MLEVNALFHGALQIDFTLLIPLYLTSYDLNWTGLSLTGQGLLPESVQFISDEMR